MAQPSSSHHGERHHRSERERERERHHHSRTISSTTLLLVLSLVLAVLAVMLSLPATSTGSDATSGVMGILTPKRTQALIARESAVAVREAEVARREAELLAGAPGGVVAQPPAASQSPVLCPVCTPTMVTETISLPAQTIIKEIVKEDSLAPAGWSGPRTEELIERELKIAERERDISKREENVNRREHDAARRESWIMEQLISLGNDVPQTVEEEYIYEQPPKRKLKPAVRDLPFASEYEPKTIIQTQTVTHAPANTRLAASPIPNVVSPSTTPSTPRTTAVEEVEERPRPVIRAPKRQPTRWFGAW